VTYIVDPSRSRRPPDRTRADAHRGRHLRDQIMIFGARGRSPALWSYVPPQRAETFRSCSHGRRTAIFSLNSMQVLRTSAVISVQFSI
jgi:hypothetical protein